MVKLQVSILAKVAGIILSSTSLYAQPKYRKIVFYNDKDSVVVAKRNYLLSFENDRDDNMILLLKRGKEIRNINDNSFSKIKLTVDKRSFVILSSGQMISNSNTVLQAIGFFQTEKGGKISLIDGAKLKISFLPGLRKYLTAPPEKSPEVGAHGTHVPF
jgi:hypothetical protein